MKNLLEDRSSVRKFLDKEVEQEKLDSILRAAMTSPTAANQRPWHFYVVKNKEILVELSKSSPYAGPVANAPVAIVICYDKDNMIFPPYGDIDCAIASQTIWLATEAVGLGTVMIGIAPIEERMTAAAKILNLPENMVAFTYFPIGYPAEKPGHSKERYEPERIHIVE